MAAYTTEDVLRHLQDAIESDGFKAGFGIVYLDNARPAGMHPRAFAGHLSQLEQRGLYTSCGDGCFGEVKRPADDLG